MKIKRISLIISMFLVLSMVLYDRLNAGLLVIPHVFSPGDPRRPSEINDNFTAVANSVNNVEAVQIAAGAVIEAKIGNLAVTSGKIAANAVTTSKILDLNVTEGKLATGAVTDAKMNCSGDWGILSDCDGVGVADSMHTHSLSGMSGQIYATNVLMVNATHTFASSTVEGALHELANFTGYSTSSPTPSTYLEYYGFETGGASSITIPANSASNKILVTATVELNMTNCGSLVVLGQNVNYSIGGGPSTATGTISMLCGTSGGADDCGGTYTAIYKITPVADQSTNIHWGGIVWGGGCAGISVTNYSLLVQGY